MVSGRADTYAWYDLYNGRWQRVQYMLPHTATTFGTAGDLAAFAWQEMERVFTVQSMGVFGIATSGTYAVRVGIYSDNGSGYPGSLLSEQGLVSITSADGTGIKGVDGTDVTLAQGLYWLATLLETNPATGTREAMGQGDSQLATPNGRPGNNANATKERFHGLLAATGVGTGSLPATFPAGAYEASLEASSFAVPYIKGITAAAGNDHWAWAEQNQDSWQLIA